MHTMLGGALDDGHERVPDDLQARKGRGRERARELVEKDDLV